MSGKHKSGYELLKARYVKLEAENKKLHDRVARQSSHISQLVADLNSLEHDLMDRQKTILRLKEHMGWFRRWLWKFYER